MTSWSDQPPALAATLNPVLLGTVLAWGAGGYFTRAGRAMPWPLAFVIPAMVLHPDTRAALPAAVSKRLLVWRRENEELVAGLPARCLSLKPYTSMGFRAGLRHGLLVVEGAGLKSGMRPADTPEELAHVQRSAALVGRWLAPLPPVTVLAQLGMTT